MKKVILATTALVASVGFAQADVTIGGDGRMGIVYDGNDYGYTSRIRISFTASGETDGGLAFGGSIRADNAGGGASGTAGSVFISGDFGKLSMGDVDSGAKAAVGNISGVGLTGLGDYHELQYLLSASENESGNSEISASVRPAVLYEYSTGAFSFFLGTSNPTNQSVTGDVETNGLTVTQTVVALDISNSFSVGASYAGDNWNVAAGYETLDGTSATAVTDILTGVTTTTVTDLDGDSWYIGGDVSFGDATLKANYGAGDLIDNQYGVSIDYTFDATTLTAFYSQRELGSRLGGGSTDRWGVGASYDLGGGASLVGGVASLDGDEQADFGIKFNF